jgi:hypothetical protein
MRVQKWLLLTTTAIFILSGIVCLSGCTEYQLSCCTEHQYEKGPVFIAAMATLSQPGPVRDDLIERGLATYPDDETGEAEVVKVGEIEKLVEAGVYEIDEEGYLAFGPSYTPPP